MMFAGAQTLKAGNEALGVWFRLRGWSTEHGTPGRVPLEAVRLATRRRVVVERLLDAGLLEPDPESDGFVVHDLSGPATAAQDARRAAISAARRAAGAAGAAARWGARPEPVCHPEPMANASGLPSEPMANADDKTARCHLETSSQDLSRSPLSPDPISGGDRGYGSPFQETRALEADGKADGKTVAPPDGKTHPDELETAEVVQVLEQLRAARALAPIATMAFARHAASYCNSGGHTGRLDIADVLRALAACDAAIAGAVAAGEIPPTRETLARQATGFLRRTRKGEAKEQAAREAGAAPRGGRQPAPASADVVSAAGRALRAFSAVYEASGRRYGRYVPAPGDDVVAAELAAHARRLALEEVERRGAGAPPAEQLEEELVRHWATGYLREDGAKQFLREKRHALAWLARDIPAYGSPWATARPPRALQPAPGPSLVPPPAEALEALRGLARGIRPPSTAPLIREDTGT